MTPGLVVRHGKLHELADGPQLAAQLRQQRRNPLAGGGRDGDAVRVPLQEPA